MTDIGRVHALVERLRKSAIGEPSWIAEKQVYEYGDRTAKTVAVLKLVRAAQGITALDLLCRAGLFIDFGALVRCVSDCTDEVYFLLENYPDESGNVRRFVKGFFEGTIDGYLTGETPAVESRKIRAAVVRVLKGDRDHATQEALEKLYKTFCGYVHASYECVMEVYNVQQRDFSLGGVPSVEQIRQRMPYVEHTALAIMHAAAFIAQRYDMKELFDEIARTVLDQAQ